MGDFHQSGVIATLHNLKNQPVEILEQQLLEFGKNRPIGLILPSLFSELEGPALGGILDHLSKVEYLSEIIIGLDRANEKQFQFAKEYFSRLPQRHRILWNDGPRLLALDKKLREIELAPKERGKGRNVWYCLGYALASKKAEVIGLHDCDIVTYDRSLLARLVYPVANPYFSYVFSKGYYSRVSKGKMTGRVNRLLVTPLLLALKKTLGPQEYIDYLAAFRYPLAGEFAMRSHVVSDLRIPSDWGLEIGILSEIRRNFSNKVICQTDLTDVYDHKHQTLSSDNPNGGLSKMSIDIAKAIFRKLATDGIILSMETIRTVKASYNRIALDLIQHYSDDAQMNGLTVDRHKEEEAVELFAANIMLAGQIFFENPMEVPFIPAWSRVYSALPSFMDELKEAVEADNAEIVGA